MADDDAFLSRWSRRKALVRQGVQPPEPPRAPEPPPPVARAALPEVASAPVAEPVDERPAAPPAPTMDDVAQLTPDAPDFSRFVQPGVGADVKNAALKKLFADPHFNVMDGLDIYIDDYSKPDPLPPEMLRQMVQGRFLGLFDDEPAEHAEPDPAAVAQAAGVEASPPAPHAVDGADVVDSTAAPVAAAADAASPADAAADMPTALPDPHPSAGPPAA